MAIRNFVIDTLNELAEFILEHEDNWCLVLNEMGISRKDRKKFTDVMKTYGHTCKDDFLPTRQLTRTGSNLAPGTRVGATNTRATGPKIVGGSGLAAQSVGATATRAAAAKTYGSGLAMVQPDGVAAKGAMEGESSRVPNASTPARTSGVKAASNDSVLAPSAIISGVNKTASVGSLAETPQAAGVMKSVERRKQRSKWATPTTASQFLIATVEDEATISSEDQAQMRHQELLQKMDDVADKLCAKMDVLATLLKDVCDNLKK